MRRVLRQLWTSPTLHCVLAELGEPPFYFVQLLKDERTIYAQRVTGPDHADPVARDLWAAFVEHPQ